MTRREEAVPEIDSLIDNSAHVLIHFKSYQPNLTLKYVIETVHAYVSKTYSKCVLWRKQINENPVSIQGKAVWSPLNTTPAENVRGEVYYYYL